MEQCIFCNESLSNGEPTVTLGQKGCDGIHKASEARMSDIKVIQGQVVHTKCRREHVNPNDIVSYNRKRAGDLLQEEAHCSLRSSTESTFSYKEHCLFCGCADVYDGRKLDYKLIPVRTMDFKDKIIEACDKYENDWVDTVRDRVVYAHDLPAADAVYHQLCSVNFRTGKQIPHLFKTKVVQRASKYPRFSGRPKDLIRAESFLKIAEYLEQNDDEQTTVGDLILKMSEYTEAENCDPYSFKYMKTELVKHFGDKIIITEICGKQNVVTFRSTASKILFDFHHRQKNKAMDQANQIVETAAKLIKNDIKGIIQSRDTYPEYCEIASADKAIEYLPESLKTFLSHLFCGSDVTAKLASVGQAIMQATRPRVLIVPLQMGLGVQMHHHFQSKFLIDSLHKHGFCCSYSEVKTFERSSAVMQGTDIPNLNSNHFLQYSADNVDHNIRSIDGKNTFHGMGIIVSITPSSRSTESIIRRVNITSEDIASVGRINIHNFIPEKDRRNSMSYANLPDNNTEEPYTRMDLLWKTSLLLKVPRPLWSGFMQMVHKADHPGQSSVMFLPMIDMDPNDLTCIYSTLTFVASHARRHNSTAVVTFDQPLWWKAHSLVESQPENSDIRSVVVRLGGFHTQMSFLGSIGHLMGGSGLHELLEIIYAGNTVGHILSGKAVARALRGHFLIDAALNALVAARVFKVDMSHERTEREIAESSETSSAEPVPSQNVSEIPDVVMETSSSSTGPQETKEDMQALTGLLENLLSGSASANDVETNDVLIKFEEALQKEKSGLQDLKTSQLWFQYMDMIDILRRFIKGERMGHWQLHLQSIQDMLPYFAASGHNNYLKSVHIYLQKMYKLHIEHPHIYKHFSEGLHVIRRSDRAWAGLSADLVIEQCLMRSVKTTGGLTRGRGMTETQRLIWVLSTPACAEINNAMQELTSVTYATSEQHKDSTKSRMTKDKTDTEDLLQYLAPRNPFSAEPSLRNIATGVTAHPTVNAYQGKAVGQNIMSSMEGQQVGDYTFRRKNQAVTMDAKSSVKIRGEEVHVDPQLLFQRLITAGVRSDELSEIFKYELCTYPPAIFASRNVMRTANKSSLAIALWSPTIAADVSSDQVQCVLDGGALLHRIPWTMGTTWEHICNIYSQYVTSKYGKAVVVFDGYSDAPSTKDCAHASRTGGCVGVAVHCSSQLTLQIKKEEFLSNKENKQHFIDMLAQKLEETGCEVHHADGDADLLIVKKTIESAARQNTVLIADDTDLLVLLLYHATDTQYNIFLKPEPKKQSLKSPRTWDINAARSLLGGDVCDNILFIHSILGCDTTSRPFGIGKKTALVKIRKDVSFLEQAKVFMRSDSTKEDVIKAGEAALVSVYNGGICEPINDLRIRRFYDKTTSSTAAVQPHTLPPTAAATKTHSLRVYQQVQVWKGEEDRVPPENWGWHVSDGKMMPIMTDLPAAPQELLEIIRCNCKSGCHTMRCTCKKNGMDCSMACGECRGVCANLTTTTVESDSDSEQM